jgi:hypothetical protein
MPRKGLMSRVRAYLSECLVSVVHKSPLVFPIPDVSPESRLAVCS